MSRPVNDRRPIPAFPTCRPQQAGAALVTAMLIVALAAATASLLLVRMERWIDRVALTRDKAQAAEFARSGTAYARAVLAADAAGSAIDALDEDWARVLPPLRHESAEVSGRIDDAQSRFNLNNLRRDDGLIDESALAAYRRLLAVLGLPDELADTLADWLDADDSPRAAGAEAAYYLAQGRPAGAPGRPLDHLAGLSRIKGYTPRHIERLHPFVIALAGQQPVNVNTAAPEVLSALQPGLGLAAARALARSRDAVHFLDTGDFRKRLPADNLPTPLLSVAAASQHFLISVEVRNGQARSHLSSLVYRQPTGQASRILWQSIQ